MEEPVTKKRSRSKSKSKSKSKKHGKQKKVEEVETNISAGTGSAQDQTPTTQPPPSKSNINYFYNSPSMDDVGSIGESKEMISKEITPQFAAEPTIHEELNVNVQEEEKEMIIADQGIQDDNLVGIVDKEEDLLKLLYPSQEPKKKVYNSPNFMLNHRKIGTMNIGKCGPMKRSNTLQTTPAAPILE